MKPEEEARKKINVLLEKAGWFVQDYKDLNLGGGAGVAATLTTNSLLKLQIQRKTQSN